MSDVAFCKWNFCTSLEAFILDRECSLFDILQSVAPVRGPSAALPLLRGIRVRKCLHAWRFRSRIRCAYGVSLVYTHFRVIALRAPAFISQESRDENRASSCVYLIPVVHFLQ